MEFPFEMFSNDLIFNKIYSCGKLVSKKMRLIVLIAYCFVIVLSGNDGYSYKINKLFYLLFAMEFFSQN